MRQRAGILWMMGLLLTVAGIALVYGSARPNQTMARRLQIDAAQTALPLRGTVELSYPPQIKMGEVGVVQITLTAAQIDLPEPSLAEARLELPGATLQPADPLLQPLKVGSPVKYFWNFRLEDEQPRQASLWLTLVQPEEGQGDRRYLIAVIPLEMQAQRVWGMSAPAARWLGGGSLVAGLSMVLVLWRSQRKLSAARP